MNSSLLGPYIVWSISPPPDLNSRFQQPCFRRRTFPGFLDPFNNTNTALCNTDLEWEYLDGGDAGAAAFGVACEKRAAGPGSGSPGKTGLLVALPLSQGFEANDAEE
jgi:hypothetical protein